MYANQARNIASKAVQNQIESLLKKINEAAEEGQFFVDIQFDAEEPSPDHLKELERLGYEWSYNKYYRKLRIKWF